MSEAVDEDRLCLFYRFWTLKESYIKATGAGIYDRLNGLDFHLPMTQRGRLKQPQQDQIISGAQLYLHKATASGEDKGNDAAKLSDRWLFEETRLPNNHLVAVCSDLAPPRHSDPPCRFTDRTFKEVKISDLIKDAGRLHCPVLAEWTDFDAKHYHAQLGVRSISGSLNEGHLEF